MNKLLKIIVIGVGGGGSNMVNYLIDNFYSPYISYYIANTDKQVLIEKENLGIIQLGENISKGLGAGMNPEIGLMSAKANEEELLGIFHEADLVFVSVGMGGGTGTGAAPYIASLARDSGALTIGVSTLPFKFEGKKRTKIAEKGLENLKNSCDSLIIIENENLLSLIDKKAGIKSSFKKVDSVLSEAVIGTSGVILSTGNNDINLDFADLKTIMSHEGLALMGIGYSGKSAEDAIEEALKSPLLKNLSIDNSKGVIVHFECHPDYSFIDLSMSLEVVHEKVSEEADIIFGTTTNSELEENELKVTIIATGIQNEEEIEIKESKNIIRMPRLDLDLDRDNLETPSYLRYG